MKFIPLTNEQIDAISPTFEPGLNEFIVKDAIQKTSKAGNEMIELKLEVSDNKDHTALIYDYIVSKDNCMWKLKNFCEQVGLIENYNIGFIEPSDCLNKTGTCITRYRKATTEFSERLIIKEYCKKDNDSLPTKTESNGSSVIIDDSIPF